MTIARRVLLFAGLLGLGAAQGPAVGMEVRDTVSHPTARVDRPGGGIRVVQAGGFTYVTKKFDLGKEWKTFRAPCPAGTHVLGGGHYNDHGFSTVIGAHSYPYDDDDAKKEPDDGWAALLGGFTGGIKVKIYATCAGVMPRYVSQSQTVEVRSSNVQMTLVCPAAKPNPAAGGSRGHRMVQETSSWAPIPSDTWKLEADNLDNESHGLTGIAVCTDHTIDAQLQPGSTASRAQGYVAATCPFIEDYFVGGGFVTDVAPLGTKVIAATRPDPIGVGWQLWVDNFHASQSLDTFVYAYCSLAIA